MAFSIFNITSLLLAPSCYVSEAVQCSFKYYKIVNLEKEEYCQDLLNIFHLCSLLINTHCPDGNLFFSFFHISCSANFNMILFHLEMDFYFGLVVDVSGREKLGGHDKQLPPLGHAMLWEQRVCVHSVLYCVCRTARSSNNELLSLCPLLMADH